MGRDMPAPAPKQITAVLVDGPLKGRSTKVDAVEGRPPSTVDLDRKTGARCRYVLEQLEQSGHTARYSFLYDV